MDTIYDKFIYDCSREVDLFRNVIAVPLKFCAPANWYALFFINHFRYLVAASRNESLKTSSSVNDSLFWRHSTRKLTSCITSCPAWYPVLERMTLSSNPETHQANGLKQGRIVKMKNWCENIRAILQIAEFMKPKFSDVSRRSILLDKIISDETTE